MKAIEMHAALVLVLLASRTFSAASAQTREVPPDTKIRLERTACFGSCPAYSVTIDAQGNVTYYGKDFVRVKGRQRDRIPVAEVRALLDTAERIGFFEMREHYRTVRNPDGSETIVTDMPTAFVSLTTAGRSKRIEDYFGTPEALREFERDIETAARIKRWVRIDQDTLRERVYFAPEMDELFVKAGAPVEALDGDGRTALWLPACDGNAGVGSR